MIRVYRALFEFFTFCVLLSLYTAPFDSWSYSECQAIAVMNLYGNAPCALTEFLPSLAFWPEASYVNKNILDLPEDITSTIKYVVERTHQAFRAQNRSSFGRHGCRYRLMETITSVHPFDRNHEATRSTVDFVDTIENIKSKLGQKLPCKCNELLSTCGEELVSKAEVMIKYLDVVNEGWVKHSQSLINMLERYCSSSPSPLIDYCVLSNTQLPISIARCSLCQFALPLERLYCGNSEYVGKHGAVSVYLADLYCRWATSISDDGTVIRRDIGIRKTMLMSPDYTAIHTSIGHDSCNGNDIHLSRDTVLPKHTFFKQSKMIVKLPRIEGFRSPSESSSSGDEEVPAVPKNSLRVRLNAALEDMLPWKLVPGLSPPAGCRVVFIGDGTEEASVAASYNADFIRIRNVNDLLSVINAITVLVNQ